MIIIVKTKLTFDSILTVLIMKSLLNLINLQQAFFWSSAYEHPAALWDKLKPLYKEVLVWKREGKLNKVVDNFLSTL